MLDNRANPSGLDAVDERRADIVDQRLAPGVLREIIVSVAALRSRPNFTAGIETELLRGERVQVRDLVGGWAWVRADHDGYTGYMPECSLGIVSDTTHRIVAPRTFLYPAADLRRPPLATLSIGSRVRLTGRIVDERGNDYLVTEDGQGIIASHCALVDEPLDGDYVAVARLLIGTPYLWGGRSAFGIDCSGLLQLSMMMTGRLVARNADVQRNSIGDRIGDSDLMRGDLVFWDGHVGIMADEETLLHANGQTMSVALQPLSAVIGRMGPAQAFRRPSG